MICALNSDRMALADIQQSRFISQVLQPILQKLVLMIDKIEYICNVLKLSIDEENFSSVFCCLFGGVMF